MRKLLAIAVLFCLGLGSVIAQDTLKLPEVVTYGEVSNYTLGDSLAEITALNNSAAADLSRFSSTFIRQYGPGQLATVASRGFQSSHTNVVWEGVSLQSPMNGQLDLNLLPAVLYDQISFDPTTVVADGMSNAGGVVELSNNRIRHDQIKLGISRGSFGFENYQLDLNVGNYKWGQRIRLFYTAAENNYKVKEAPNYDTLSNAEQLAYGGIYDARYRHKKHALDFHVWFQENNRNIAPTLNETFSNAFQNDLNLRSVINYRYTGAKHQIGLKMAYLDERIYFENSKNSIVGDNRSVSYVPQLNILSNLNKRWSVEQTFVYRNSEAQAIKYNGNKTQERYQLLEQLKYDKDSFQLSLGSRVIAQNGETSILPFGYVNWHTKGMIYSLYLAKQARYPTLNDLYWNPGGNPNLQKEDSYTAELTLLKKWRFWGVEVKPFASLIQNQLLWQPGNFGYWQPIQITDQPTKNYGVETNLKVIIPIGAVRFKLKTFYTYTQSLVYNSGNDVYNQQIFVPLHQGGLIGQFIWKDWSLFSQATFNGYRYINTNNTDFLPNYFLVNAGLAYQNQRNFTAGINVNNLLNTQYQVLPDRPMPPVSVSVNLQYTLNFNDIPKIKIFDFNA